MSRRCLRRFVCILLFVPVACVGQGAKGTEDQIIKMTQEVVAAEVQGNTPMLDRVLTDNYLHTHATGLVQNKTEFIGDGKPKYTAGEISQIQVRLFGTSAIVNGHELVNGDHHYVFSAVWIQEQGKWRLAAWVTNPDPKNPRDRSAGTRAGRGGDAGAPTANGR
jgi:hypothetical protein